MKIRNNKIKLLYDFKESKDNIIKLKKIEEIDKVSIVSDAMFKTMFLKEERKKYGAYLISLIVDVSYEYLLDNLKITNSELSKDNIYRKGERCDYVAEVEDTILNIEVNNNNSKKTLERNLEYAFRLYAKMVKRKEKKYNYKQTIQINLNNFSFKGIEDIMRVNYLQDDKNIVLTDKIIIVNIYLPNLMNTCYTKDVEKLSSLEKYIYALIEYDVEKLEKIIKEGDIVKEYVEEALDASKEDDLREAYDHEQADKEQEYIYGYDDGKQKGIEQNKKEVAIKLHINGESKIKICEILEMTEEELDEYLGELKDKSFYGEAYDHKQADKEQEYIYGYDDGKQKGIEQGIEQKEREVAINLYKNDASKELICKSLNISKEKLENYLKEAN